MNTCTDGTNAFTEQQTALRDKPERRHQEKIPNYILFAWLVAGMGFIAAGVLVWQVG